MHISLRILVVAGALALWFLSQRLIARKAPAPDGVGDWLHEWSAPLHGWLASHARAADWTLIVSSAFVDLFGLYLLGATLFGSTFRPFIALLSLFVLRQVCQAISTLPAPRGMIWRNPGVPSLLVTYGTSNDFFFSGHTAVAVLGAIELASVCPPELAVAAGVIAAAEAAVVIVLRAHYAMDVFAAAFAAWGCATFARHVAPAVDAGLARLGGG